MWLGLQMWATGARVHSRFSINICWTVKILNWIGLQWKI
jgi:hypothetical protein